MERGGKRGEKERGREREWIEETRGAVVRAGLRGSEGKIERWTECGRRGKRRNREGEEEREEEE